MGSGKFRFDRVELTPKQAISTPSSINGSKISRPFVHQNKINTHVETSNLHEFNSPAYKFDAKNQTCTSRLIIKNLPKHLTEKRLKEHVEHATDRQCTDCRIIAAPNGKSRNFAFIGFKTSEAAMKCKEALNKTFIDTNRVLVEDALAPGETNRPWSKYSPGSSAYEKAKIRKASKEQKIRKPGIVFNDTENKLSAYTTNPVISTKAGMASERKHTLFDVQTEAPVNPEDLDWLNSKIDKKIEEKIDEKNQEKQEEENRNSNRTPWEHGGIYICNLPYSCSENDLRNLVREFGEIATIKMMMTKGKFTGRAIIQYAFPEHAQIAYNKLSCTIFQGRRIHVYESNEIENNNTREIKNNKKDFKNNELKKYNEQSWNLLFVSANAAVDLIAKAAGIEKGEFLNIHDTGLATKVALSEAKVITQTKEWLKQKAINIDSFQRIGSNLLTSKPLNRDSNDNSNYQLMERARSTLVIKHLHPLTVKENDLERVFAASGDLIDFSLAPTKVVAVAEYSNESAAKRALERTAFKKYCGLPLYVEIAPDTLHMEPRKNASKIDSTVESTTKKDESDDDMADQHCSIKVDNINFKTTDENLEKRFSLVQGFVKATIVKKAVASSKEDGKKLISSGYGFVEFKNKKLANEAITRMQGILLDDHRLELQISKKNNNSEKRTPNLEKEPEKIIVKNLAFQTSKEDLRTLFSAFGEVRSIRIPKKQGGTFRGFAFVEMVRRSELKAAVEALQHTHLYGRHLIIEAAALDDVTVEQNRAKQAQNESQKSSLSESKLRHAHNIATKRKRKMDQLKNELSESKRQREKLS